MCGCRRADCHICYPVNDLLFPVDSATIALEQFLGKYLAGIFQTLILCDEVKIELINKYQLFVTCKRAIDAIMIVSSVSRDYAMEYSGVAKRYSFHCNLSIGR